MLPTTSPDCPEKLTGPPLSHARSHQGPSAGAGISTLVRFANTTDKRREAAVDMNTYQGLAHPMGLGSEVRTATPFKKYTSPRGKAQPT